MTKTSSVRHLLLTIALLAVPHYAAAQPELGEPAPEEAPPAPEEAPPAPEEAPPAPEEAPPAEPADVDVPEPPSVSLVPEGEEERMGNHAVDTFRFRPGKGLELRSADGEFSLATRFRVQFLHEVEVPDSGDAVQNFTVRRARLQLGGNFFGADNTFKFELAVSPRDEGIRNNLTGTPRTTPMLDYYVEFRQVRDLNIRIGQYKIPHNRQRVISSGDQQFVDRSIVNGEFNLDRDVGFDLRSRDLGGLDLIRYYAGAYIGRGRGAVGDDDFHMLYLARVELLPFGSFDDYDEVDFERSLEPRLSIGLGYAYADHGIGLRGNQTPADDGGTTDVHSLNADFVFMWAGLSISTEFLLRDSDRHPGGAVDETGMLIPVEDPRDGFGVMSQVGYLLPRLPVEIAARYAAVRAMGTSSISDQNELGLGFSWYLAHHSFKVQADVFQLWGEDFGDGDLRTRLQLQAAF